MTKCSPSPNTPVTEPHVRTTPLVPAGTMTTPWERINAETSNMMIKGTAMSIFFLLLPSSGGNTIPYNSPQSLLHKQPTKFKLSNINLQHKNEPAKKNLGKELCVFCFCFF
jgi:hypothetical protein